LALRDNLGQIEERAVDGGDRDAVDDGDVGRREGGRAMNSNALVLAARAAGDGRVDPCVPPRAELVQGRRRPMRQGGTRAASEHSSHAEPFAREQRLGDQGVHGVVDAVQAAGADAFLNGTRAQAPSWRSWSSPKTTCCRRASSDTARSTEGWARKRPPGSFFRPASDTTVIVPINV
jgi:hypothetical protein